MNHLVKERFEVVCVVVSMIFVRRLFPLDGSHLVPFCERVSSIRLAPLARRLLRMRWLAFRWICSREHA